MKYLLTASVIILILVTGCKKTKCRSGMHDWVVDCVNNKKPKHISTQYWMSQCRNLAEKEFCYEIKDRD